MGLKKSKKKIVESRSYLHAQAVCDSVIVGSRDGVHDRVRVMVCSFHVPLLVPCRRCRLSTWMALPISRVVWSFTFTAHAKSITHALLFSSCKVLSFAASAFFLGELIVMGTRQCLWACVPSKNKLAFCTRCTKPLITHGYQAWYKPTLGFDRYLPVAHPIIWCYAGRA